MVEVRKKERESTESLLRRFKKRVQQSGILIQARKGRFYTKKKSKKLLREAAARKKEFGEQREHLRRMGKIDLDFKFPKSR